MNFCRLLAIALFAAPVCAFAQPADLARLEASPRHHEWVEVKRGEHVVHTFVAYPEKSGKTAAVILIHENRGLTDWVRATADKLAGEGYLVLAPDLLSGTGPNGGRTKDFASGDAAREAIGKLKAPDVVADLGAVADYAKTIPSASGTLFVGGFCWGGGRTWDFAAARADLLGAFVFYGTPGDGTLENAKKIPCAVYGFYGGNDARVNSTLEKSGAALKAAGKTFEPVIYDGAGHAFMRLGEEATPTPANKKAMEEAWVRLLKLLASTHS
ncbi:MAG: dienelactone hydrolase family protein [Nibricoccus sp.]